jgi:hypothetical protein
MGLALTAQLSRKMQGTFFTRKWVGPTPRISILREEEFPLASDRIQSHVLTIQLADGSKQPHATRLHLTASTAPLTLENISWNFQVFVTHNYIS